MLSGRPKPRCVRIELLHFFGLTGGDGQELRRPPGRFPGIGQRRRSVRFVPVDNIAMEGEMNWDQVAGNWKQLRGSVKEKWGRLTDDDLDRMAGQRDQLVGRLQEHYGMAKEEAEKEADRWASGIERPRH